METSKTSISAGQSAELDWRIKERLGRSAELVSAADREWLAKEAMKIEDIRHRLLAVETGPLDFAAMSLPPAPSRA